MQLNFNKIILHHSKTKDGKSVSWDAIIKYHKEVNGWSDVGYHFCIEQVGDKIKVFAGRPLTEYGSHCKMHNTGSVGICIIGDYDSEKLSLEKELMLVDLCVFLCLTFGIKPKEIYGDRDFHPTKTCPGKLFPLQRIKDNISRVIISYQAIHISMSDEIITSRDYREKIN